ncbi:MAG TPA: M48 family metallopeptidase [Bacteriovoracaceae bacterium]|nr:M48 family metallopeptidase [Bacteriovoracaceae bacterium]
MNSLYTYYLQVTFISLIVINHLTEIYLARRQVNTFQKKNSEVPGEFKAFLTLSDHQKAISYATSKLGVSQFRLLWDAVLLFYWFPFRGAEELYKAIPVGGIHHEVLFLIAFSGIQMVLSLPWSVYTTFVLEERYGFNRSTPRIFILDRMKGLVLAGVLGVPLLYGIFYLYQSFAGLWWLWCFLFITAFQFGLLWLYPNFIAPLFNKFKPLAAAELKSGIEELVTKSGFNAREVFVMDASKRSSHGNAYFTGLGKNKRVVFFDTLLSALSKDEILAILAHELGHMKLKHIPKSLVVSIVISFVSFFVMGRLASSPWFYNGHFVRVLAPSVLFLLFTQALPLYTFWFSPLSSWISRRREFDADAYAARETKAEDLVSGLLKLYQQNSSPVVTDKVYSTFYHSHPPAHERIKRLESLEGKSR